MTMSRDILSLSDWYKRSGRSLDFDDWQVCWLGGWNKHRRFYLVMLVKVATEKPFTTPPAPKQGTATKGHKQKTPPVKSRRR